MKKLSLFSLILFLVGQQEVAIAAPPTSGAYVDDPVNSYVQDQALEPIESVNMIMCFMASLRAESMVGKSYNALVDKNKCENKGEGGESNSAGASSAVEYTKVVVSSARADDSSPLIAKGWVNMIQPDKDGGNQTIYTYSSVTKGASASAPNGNLVMDFAGYPVSTPDTRFFRGQLAITDSAINFTEQGDFPTGSLTRKLTISQSGTSTGSGRISQEAKSPSGVLIDETDQTFDFTFAYNSTHFTRKKTHSKVGEPQPDQQCFSRRKDLADISVWRYGVYKSDGSRLNLENPGFPLTYTSSEGTNYWGFAGYWGIYFPDAALKKMGASALVKSQDGKTEYSYAKVGGKLYKNTRKEATLGDVKGLPLMVWLPSNTGPWTEVKVIWDPIKTQLLKTETVQECGQDGCTRINLPISPAVPVDRSSLPSWQTTLDGWSEALGGSLSIKLGTSFSSADPISYRTREAVPPTIAQTLTLKCVHECLAGGTTLNSQVGTNGQGDPYLPLYGNNSSTRYQAPVANPVTYTFDQSGMMLVSGAAVDGSALALSGNNEWGLRSNNLVVDSNAIKCDSSGGNSATDHYCLDRIQSTDVTYEWETGPKPWNQFASVTPSGGTTAVTFDPPKRLRVTLSSINSTAANDKIGSSLQLDYQGFGDLHGIPGSCYNPADNSKGPCDSTTYTNWAPDFSLKAGAEVEDAADSKIKYYVKPIDQEIRFAKVDTDNCNTLRLPDAAVLPNMPIGDDAKKTIGDQPKIESAPAVIHGVVQ